MSEHHQRAEPSELKRPGGKLEGGAEKAGSSVRIEHEALWHPRRGRRWETRTSGNTEQSGGAGRRSVRSVGNPRSKEAGCERRGKRTCEESQKTTTSTLGREKGE